MKKIIKTPKETSSSGVYFFSKNILKKFNIEAFLLGSFYYIRHGFYKTGLFLFCLPLIVFIVIFYFFQHTLQTSSLFALSLFSLSFLALHLLYAFMSSQCQLLLLKQKRDPSTKKQMTTPVLYFSISLKRLIFFSIISAGLYQLYWAYQNWKAIKTATKESITPFLRSWFFYIFWIYSLFHRIRYYSSPQNKRAKFFTVCTFAYIIFLILGIIPLDKNIPEWKTLDIFILAISFALIFKFYFVTTFLLIPVQLTINAYRKTLDPTHLPLKKISVGEILTLISGALIFYGTYIFTFQNEEAVSLTWEENSQINFVIKNTYYNTIGYQIYCTQHGYPLKKYPNLFLEKVKDDLDTLEQKLSLRQIHLAELMQAFIQNNQDNVQKEINKELNSFRKELILEGVAQNTQVSTSELKWKPEWDQLILSKEVCQILDIQAADLIQGNTELFHLIHQYVNEINL